MCEHDDFEIIYYRNGVMIRLCRKCDAAEMNIDRPWINIETVRKAILAVTGGIQDH